MNSFCRECCGKDVDAVVHCTDKNCPFYHDRRENLDWQNVREGKDVIDLS